MQRLVPPVVSGNAEAVDCRRDVLHLRDFFLERHPGHEIGHAMLERQVGILIVPGLRGATRGQGRETHERG